MRQHVTHSVHDLDCPLRIRDADMDVEAEGKQRAGDYLILFNDQLIPCILKNLLILPMREWMGAGSDNLQSLLAYQAGENATKICDIGACRFYFFADPRLHVGHRL